MVTSAALALVGSACTPVPASAPSASPTATGATRPEGANPAHELIAFTTMSWGQVIVAPPSGEGLSELALGPAVGPIDLSPDGRRLAVSVAGSSGTRTVALADADGSNVQTITPDPGLGLVVGGWSADSRMLSVAIASDRSDTNGVLVLDPASGRRSRITTAPGHSYDYPVAWSPDGRRLAFMRVQADLNEFVGDLYVVPAAGGTPARLNPSGTTVRHYYIGPASFFPDSRRIAFVAGFNNVDARGILYSNGRVYVADADGRNRRAVSRYHDWMTSTRVSPDGRWLVFDHAAPEQPDHYLFLVRPDGTEEHRIAASPNASCCAVWSPDGSHLLASVDGDSANNLLVLPMDGSAPVALTHAQGKQFAFYSWSHPS